MSRPDRLTSTTQRRAHRGSGLLTTACTVLALGALAAGCTESPPTDGAPTAEAKSTAASSGEGMKQSVKHGPGGAGLGTPEADEYLADLGFRPQTDGFSFPNGDRDDRTGARKTFPANSDGFLNADGVHRLFGDGACQSVDDDECELTPRCQLWMEAMNRAMNGGQCEGMAVFSLTMFKELDAPHYFKEGATSASELARDDVRAPLGYYFVYQGLEPLRQVEFDERMNTTPNQTLDKIISHMQDGSDPVMLGIWSQPDQSGRRMGHAVTPYAVEDRGNGLFWVRIYENNLPNKSVYIEFDRNRNTWRYDLAQINPSVEMAPWGSGPGGRDIAASSISHRLQEAQCPCCERPERQVVVTSAEDALHALIRDRSGKTIGFQDGQWVNNIPGAQMVTTRSFQPGQEPTEPIYIIPEDAGDLDIELVNTDGSKGATGQVAVFGQGTAVVMDDVTIDPKKSDHMTISGDGRDVSYESDSKKPTKPRFKLALRHEKEGVLIDVHDVESSKGKPIKLRLGKKGQPGLKIARGNEAPKKVQFKVTRFVGKGKRRVFSHADVGKKFSDKDGIDLGGNTGKLVDKPKPKSPPKLWKKPTVRIKPFKAPPGKPTADDKQDTKAGNKKPPKLQVNKRVPKLKLGK